MTWVKANRFIFRLEAVGWLYQMEESEDFEVYSAQGNWLCDVRGDDAIALMSAIEETDLKVIDYSDPVKEFNLEGDRTLEAEVIHTENNSGIPL